MLCVVQLSPSDSDAVVSVWQAALDERVRVLGLRAVVDTTPAISRPGAFGVGILDGPTLVSLAVGLPGLADNARSTHNIPGLAHISSVATRPDRWGEGLGGRAVRAIMLQATRRGYARVQLWTHDTNAGARRLYEREGFEDSGRRLVDPQCESIRHYLRELPVPPRISRPAARLVCVDTADRVLVLHWRDPADGYRLWEPPGGGIESGETPAAAVLREWVEETSLPVPDLVAQPTLVARDSFFNGTRLVVDEHFFLGRTNEPGAPSPEAGTEVEQQTSLGYAWVPWQRLDALEDPTEPDLLPILRRLDPAGPWSR
jgi:8-oxo-dGTP pyrophosphatase MutT (NUDIX family)/GNAT superfamily N-acetyltransferase